MRRQKEVVGAIFPPKDLPYTHRAGLILDVIMNPLALPSRQTMGQLLECLLCKNIAVGRMIHSTTPFSGLQSAEAISNYLQEEVLIKPWFFAYLDFIQFKYSCSVGLYFGSGWIHIILPVQDCPLVIKAFYVEVLVRCPIMFE